jgi:hypothetical protein
VALVARLDTWEMVEMFWGLSVFLAALGIRAAWRRFRPGAD